MNFFKNVIHIFILFCTGLAFPAMAYTPVHDVISYKTLGNQLENMKEQLAALTGNKGMGNIGIDKNRNYLPADWNQALHLLEPGSHYQNLANSATDIKNNQTILSQHELNKLSPEVRNQINKARDQSAIQQALGQAAYERASQRIAVLQQLVDHVSNIKDIKSAMDLQARIQSEQAMLQNESIKIANLQQLQQAQLIADKIKQDEIRIQITGTGNFPRIYK